jgi:hypothetical protein
MLLLVAWLLSFDRAAPRRLLPLGAGILVLGLTILTNVRVQVAFALAVGLVIALAVTALSRLRASMSLSAAGLLALVAMAAAVVVWSPAANLGLLDPAALERRAAAMELTPMVELTVSKQPTRPPDVLSIGNLVRVNVGTPPHLVTGIIAGWQVSPVAYEVRLDESTVLVVPPDGIYPVNDQTVGWDAVLGRAATGLAAIFAPVASGPRMAQRALAIPDTLYWDALCVLGVFEVYRRLRTALPAPMVLLGVAVIALVVGIALVSNSTGTIVRQRAMLEIAVLVFAASPIYHLMRRLPVLTAGEASRGSRQTSYERRVVA